MQNKRVSFLVDGFNVYHSLDTLQGMSKKSVKWLDLHRLCSSYLHAVREHVGGRVDLAKVYYFSALAEFLIAKKPKTVERHRTYIRALESTGVAVALSPFKRKDATCPKCKHEFSRHEEKQTDVAIAVKMLEVFARNECQTVVLVSGDTDLIPAIETTRRLFAYKIGVAFPFMRHNLELERAADYSFKIGQRDMTRAQLPPLIELSDAKLEKPREW